MLNDFESTDLLETFEGDGLYEAGYDWEDDEGSYESMDIFESLDDEDGEDPFLGSVIGGITKLASGPMGGVLKNLAGRAATAAGQAIAGPRGAQIAQSITRRCLQEAAVDGGENEALNDFEAELATMGGDTAVLQEMAQLASMAAKAKTPQQADHFIGAIASLAGNLLPKLMGETSDDNEGDEFLPALLPIAAQVLPAAMPLISKGIKSIGRMITGNRSTREAAAVLPPIAAKSVTSLAKQAQAGKKITKDRVAATVANAAAKTLASKPAVAKAIKATKKVAKATQASREAEAEFGGYGMGAPRTYSPQARGAAGAGQRGRVIRPRYCVY